MYQIVNWPYIRERENDRPEGCMQQPHYPQHTQFATVVLILRRTNSSPHSHIWSQLIKKQPSTDKIK